MSLTAFALIVLAGLIHAGWNIVAKKTAGDARFAIFTDFNMLFAALIGGHLLGEGERGSRVLGALCIASGVAALALGRW